jgi:hypothetical protein
MTIFGEVARFGSNLIGVTVYSRSLLNRRFLLKSDYKRYILAFYIKPKRYYYYYYYYYYILHLSAKRYKELLALRLRKPFINTNFKHFSFAPFLCSSLLIYDC